MSLQNVQAEIAELIFNTQADTETVVPVDNLIIYRNNIVCTLINTLHDTYPLIVKLLGEDFFKVAAKEYISQYPSRSSNLHDYGEYFSRFLAHYPPVKSLIYLVEVAEFEWICHKIYFAADHTGFDFNRLRHISQDQYENIHFSLHPASLVKKFHYPILDIVDLCKHNPEQTVDVSKGGINLLIIRRDLQIMLVPLTDSDLQFLDAIQNGQPLKNAVSNAQRFNTSWDLESKLSQYIQDKTIVDCDIALVPKFVHGIQEKLSI